MANLLRVTLSGALPGGETWSINPIYGISFTGEAVDYSQIADVAQAISLVPVPVDVRASWSPGTNLNTVRVEARTLAGVLEELAESGFPAPAAGTGTSGHPYQTSMVVSLLTTIVGASGRGRLYWPATGRAIDIDSLRPSTIATDTFLNAVKAYLAGINTAIETVFDPSNLVVWSRKNASMAVVSSLRAGDVLDVQRRRRDALVENYSSTPWP